MTDPIGDKTLSNFYQLLKNLGYAPEIPIARDEAKQKIMSAFSPYFSNADLLQRIAEMALPANKIQLEVVSTVPWALELFQQSLKDHNEAKVVNEDQSIEIASAWIGTIYERAAFGLNLDEFKEEPQGDDLNDFTNQCREAIGNITDGLISPFCKELLHQMRTSLNQNFTFAKIDSLDFGVVVDQLSKFDNYRERLAPSPRGLGVRVWRNIADHRMMTVKKGKIVCKIGKGDARELVLTANELREVVTSLSYIMFALHLAHRVFYLDNVELKVRLGLAKADVQITNRAKRLNFGAAIAHLGFEVFDLQEINGLTIARIRDLTLDDPQSREFQIVSLAQMLWQLVRTPVELHYIEASGRPRVGVRIGNETFKKFEAGEISIIELFQETEFLKLSIG